MREIHPMQQLVKQMIEERHREARRDALATQHSRTGLLNRFLRNLARREGR